MVGPFFRTSKDRLEEEIRQQQGLGRSSTLHNPNGVLGSMMKDANEPNATYNIPGSYLPNTQPRTSQIGQNRDGTPITQPVGLDPNTISSAGAAFGLPELAAIPLAAATGYNTVTGVGNAVKGNKLSFSEQAALALPTFGASFLWNPITDFFGSGKDKNQQQRDVLRDLLVERGIGTRPEGTDDIFIGNFDAGKDGGARLTNQDGSERRYFEVDMGSPGIGETISALNPLGVILAYQSGNPVASTTGMLVNAVTAENGDAGQIKNRILDIYQRSGFTPDQVDEGLKQLAQQGKISNDDLKIYLNSVNSLSSPGQTTSLNIGGGGGMNIPQPKPQVDMSLLKPPSDPMAQTRAAYDQAQEKRLQLFPKQQGYQPLGAFK